MYLSTRFNALVVLSALMLMAVLSPGIEAATIGGTVTEEETQTGILNAEITFTLLPALQQKMTIVTDGNGDFEIELQAGEYQVHAGMLWDGYEPEVYIPEVLGDIYCTSFNCENDLANGTPLVVQNSTTIDNLDFALSKTASISGQITDENTDNLIDSVSVEAQEINTFLSYSDDYTDGNYRIDGLLPGTYKIHTQAFGYINEFYDGHAILDAPATFTPLTVEAATLYTVDFDLEPKPFVSGLVTDEQTGEPVDLARVKLYDLDNNFVGGDVTGSDGSYIIYSIAGSYKLLFDSDRHIPELHNNLNCPAFQYRVAPDSCQDAANFTVVELALDAPVQVNAELSSGSKIFGTVTDEDTGLPLYKVNYRLISKSGLDMNGYTDSTNEAGQFVIPLIPPGEYFLYIRPGSTSQYVDEFYDDVPCLSYDCDYQSEATALDFTEPAETNVDIQLTKGLSISGTVTSERTGLPITFGLVDAYSDDWNSIAGYGVFSQDGSYTINGLLSGNYYLVFSPADTEDGYYQEVHDNIVCPDWDCDYKSLATPVTLEEGGHLVIDAQLINHIMYKNGFE